MEFLKVLLKQVPLRKNVASIGISIVALGLAYLLQRLGITDVEAGAITVAGLAPLVNWIRELAKDKPSELRVIDESAIPIKPESGGAMSAAVMASRLAALRESARKSSQETDAEIQDLDRTARNAAEEIVDTMRDELTDVNTPRE